jgi:hypothetical protein
MRGLWCWSNGKFRGARIWIILIYSIVEAYYS